MNENEKREDHADPCDPTKCDPLPSETSEAAGDCEQVCDDGTEGENEGTAGEGDPSFAEALDSAPSGDSEPSALPADSDPDSDSDPSAVFEAGPEEQLQQLRDELTQLRRQMALQDALLSRMGAECEEFHTLFPNTPISSLPDNVWADVKLGIPLAAAYALAERRRAHTESLAAATNQRNGHCSTGAMKATEAEFFSPSEVRAMSQDEVRANYQKIMRSMQSWR